MQHHRDDWPILTTPDLDALIAQHAPVAIGVSGGKDSTAAAVATIAHLDAVDHRGPRILIHSDLGGIEWMQSRPQCQRLADALGVELVVVRRERGGLLDRWRQRWAANVQRYQDLSCVKLIMPWSSPGMRFCTSELKTAIICRELVERFPRHTILSVSGIRREESPRRAQAPVCKLQPKLMRTGLQTTGYDWHPILDWRKQDVLDLHAATGVPLHDAYTVYGTSRVSCSFCIMAARADLHAATTCTTNHAAYREIVDLEIASTFAFQDRQWLGDVAPHLLAADQRTALHDAQHRAQHREALEAQIPRHLWYEKGYPTAIPTWEESAVMAQIRSAMSELMGWGVTCTTATAVRDRYAALLAAKEQRR